MGWFILLGVLTAQAGQAPPDLRIHSCPPVTLFEESYDLQNPSERESLQKDVRNILSDTARTNDDANKKRKQAAVSNRNPRELTQGELAAHFHAPDGTLKKKARRGLKAITERTARWNALDGDRDLRRLYSEIHELAAAVENNDRSPIPDVGFGVMWMTLDNLSNTVGNGAEDGPDQIGSDQEDCCCNPTNSSFWKEPVSLAARDLYTGFDRRHIPDWATRVWVYRGPKTSRGANPGFEIQDGRQRAKIKFAETYSEPFTTRVFHALGYNVDITDHVRSIKLKYDRRMFREFNLRQSLMMRVRLAGLFTVYAVNMQSWHDPFDFITEAVLINGERLDTREFRERLLMDSTLPQPEQSPGNFNETFEGQVEYLVTVPVNFQIDDPDSKSVGPWGFDQLDHDQLREVRGAALLAAWLGWFDTRMDNTRLRLVDGHLKHYFSDLGGGLGRSEAAFNWKAESPNDFPWEFTEAPVVRGKGRMTTPFKVVHYHTLMDNEAFQAMSTADAVWMARLIGRLTRMQIESALAASGYDAAEQMLYAEKLVHRRNRMIQDLGLDEEFPDLPRRFETHEFDYAPPSCDHQVVGGQLMRKDPAMRVGLRAE